ncbi:MAG: hypothetical protein ACI97A_002950 [Planctomycetota bacterium]|jgi:hypothetical protein
MRSSPLRSLCLSITLTLVLAVVAEAQFAKSHTFWGRQFSGAQSFGECVRGAGDLNADGFDDIVVGAPSDHKNGQYSGTVQVFSGITGAELFEANGNAPFDYFGDSVSGAGDVNNDGFADIVVGSPGYPFKVGRADIYSGFDGSTLYTFLGGSADFTFGSEVCSLGDINNDGFDDVVIGALQSGTVRVFSGFDGSVLHTFLGIHTNDNFGRSIDNAGDVDGDGTNDLVVGTPHANQFTGAVLIFSGATGAILHTFHGNNTNDDFGTSVSTAGDLNDDGFADVLVGAPGESNGFSSNGLAYAFSGFDGSMLFQLDGNLVGFSFGAAISGGSDLDGDGFEDMIVGAPDDNQHGGQSGSAVIFSGENGQIIHKFFGDSVKDFLGYSLDFVGDTNSDGFPDIVIGAYGDDLNSTNSIHSAVAGIGAARVYLGRLVPVSSYESNVGSTTLSLGWTNTQGDPNALTGSFYSHSPSPFGRGFYGISQAPADVLTAFDFPALIALDPTNLISLRPLTYDAGGRFSVSNLSRQHPPLAGTYLYLQAFQTKPHFASSNGLKVLIAP